MYVRRCSPMHVPSHDEEVPMFARRIACCAAILALVLFTTTVRADSPGVPVGPITTGTVATNVVAPYPYGYAPGYPYGYGGYAYAPGYIVPNYLPPGVSDGISCGGVYGCP